MKTLAEQIEVMQAARGGEQIEIAIDGYRTPKRIWRDADDGVNFNWEFNDYRIKPKPLEFWVNVYSGEKGFRPAYLFEEEAIENACQGCLRTIKVREITDE